MLGLEVIPPPFFTSFILVVKGEDSGTGKTAIAIQPVRQLSVFGQHQFHHW